VQGGWDIFAVSVNYTLEVMMDDWRKYSRARNQLYSYKVGVRKHHDSISAKHRTPELVQLMEMVDGLCDTIALAFENGQIVAMQLDIYEAIPLPGFEDYDWELKNPRPGDED
jgi:hypothetical protein